MLDKRLWKEVKNNKAYLYSMVFYALTSFLVSFFMAFLLANLVNQMFILKASFYHQFFLFSGLAFVVIVRAFFIYFFHKKFKRIAAAAKNRMLLRTINGILELGPVLSKVEASGGRTTAISEAADHIEPYFSDYIPQFISIVISLPLILMVTFYYDFIAALIMLFTGPIMPFFLMLIGTRSQKANQKRLSSLTRLGSSMLDFLNGVRTLKIFGGLSDYRSLVSEHSEEFRIMTMEVLRISFLSAFVLEFAATISTAMIAVSLAIRLMYDKMDFYPAFFILLITPEYYLTIRKFGAKFHTAMGAKAAVDTLSHYFKEKTDALPDSTHDEDISDYPNSITMSNSSKSVAMSDGPIFITLKDVSYQYHNNNSKALQNINLVIPHGKITAIVGKSGSGKSTIAYSLMRFIETEGVIYFNDIDIAKVHPIEVRAYIAYIPQKPYIFHDTLRNNLLHARQTASDFEMIKAMKNAALYEFYSRLPLGLDTILSETGTNISVGEAQRLSFARAYIKNCPVIIMDEATSALDEESEGLIKTTFESISRNKTVLVIAHRLETVKNADVIYVLDSGRILESGKHKELLANNGIYKELVSTWTAEGSYL